MNISNVEDRLPDSARALAPVRVVDNALRTYTPFTADDGYSFCYTWLNRLRATGHLYDTEERMYAMIDVWDDDADIVAEFQTDREGFNYLRRKLKFKWENRDEWKSNREAAA